MPAHLRTWREAAEHFRGTFSEIHHQPETRRIYGRVLRDFGRAFGEDRPLAEITVDDLERYQLQRKRDGVAETTINKDFRGINAFLSWCVERGYLVADPTKGFRMLRVVKRVKRTLEPDLIVKILRELDVNGDMDVADWLRIDANTGARFSEVMAIRVCDVDLTRHVLTMANHGLHRRTIEDVHRMKDREDRRVPMNDVLFAVLSRRVLAAGSDPEALLFKDARCHRRMFDVLQVAANAVGAGNVNFQMIRRSFATLMAGLVPEVVLTALMGWSTVEVGRQYYIEAQRMKIQPPPNIG